MPPEAIAAGCKDIAQQLAAWPHGDGFEVIFGGGRDRFLPETMNDPEDQDRKGSRKDGRNLVQEWQNRYPNSGAFVWNKEQFDKLDAKTPMCSACSSAPTCATRPTASRTTAASRRWRR